MTANFYNLNKRRNSTKVPSDTGVAKTIVLKNGTDFDNPVFILAENMTGYNYVSWNGAYYFITGRKYIGNQTFEIICEVDPMATDASNIKASTQFVLRSSVSPDYTLIDNFYPTSYKPLVYQTPGSGVTFSDSGSYVLIVKSATGIIYYGITASGLELILDHIMGEKQETLWDTISDLGGTLGPAFLNATDYILGCRWIPFPVQGSLDTRINLGYWDSGVYGCKYDKTLKLASVAQGFVLHPFSGSKEFLNSNQFYQITIFVPGCGEIPIDASKCKMSSGLNVSFKIDVLGTISGCVTNDGNILGRFSGSLGKDVPISSSEGVASGLAGIGGGVAALVTATAGALTGGVGGVALAGLIGGGVGAMGSGISNTVPDVNTSGSLSSYFIPPGHDNFYCKEIIYDITTQNGSINGYPCMKTLTLSSNGYYQIANPQVDFGEDIYIKDKIIEYMQGGFYIE